MPLKETCALNGVKLEHAVQAMVKQSIEPLNGSRLGEFVDWKLNIRHLEEGYGDIAHFTRPWEAHMEVFATYANGDTVWVENNYKETLAKAASTAGVSDTGGANGKVATADPASKMSDSHGLHLPPHTSSSKVRLNSKVRNVVATGLNKSTFVVEDNNLLVRLPAPNLP